MSTANYKWNHTTTYYVRCTVYTNGKMTRSFTRATSATDEISACLQAKQYTIRHKTSDFHYFRVIGKRIL